MRITRPDHTPALRRYPRHTSASVIAALLFLTAVLALLSPPIAFAKGAQDPVGIALVGDATNLGFPQANKILSERMPPRASAALNRQDVTITVGRWIHITAAIIWVGTHFFVLLVLPRTLPQEVPAKARRILDVYARASKIILPAFIVLVLAGIAQNMSGSPADLGQMSLLPYGKLYTGIIASKFLIVGAAAAIGALMSFSLLKKLRAQVENSETDEEALTRTLRQVKTTSRANLTLGLTAVLLATFLPRIHYLMLVGVS